MTRCRPPARSHRHRAFRVLLLMLLAGLSGERLRADPPPEVPPPIEHVYGPPEVLVPPPPREPPTPVVAIRVKVPACAAAGEELEYHLCVENCSAAPAHHVLVRNPLPVNARFIRAVPEPTVRTPELRWDLGTLKPGAYRDIILVLKPKEGCELRNCARVQFEHGQCVCTKIKPGVPSGFIPPVPPSPGPAPEPMLPLPRPVKPGIELRKLGPERAGLRQTLAYQLIVTNTGDKDVTRIKVTDTLPAGLDHVSGRRVLTWERQRLRPGEAFTIDYQVTTLKAGRLCNKATATTAEGFRAEATHCVTAADARLSLKMTGPARQYLNLPAAYLLTVRNPGSTPLDEVNVVDPLPAGMTFVRAGNGGQLVGNAVAWRVGRLEAGQSRILQLVLKAREPGAVRNQAVATAAGGLTARAEVVTEFQGASALMVDLIDTRDPVEVGGETSYVVTITNEGLVPVTNVQVRVLIPKDMKVLRARGPADNHLGERVAEGQNLVYDPLKTLAPGAAVTYEVFAQALTPGDVRFRATITADQLRAGGPVVEEESTTLYSETSARRFPARPGRGISAAVAACSRASGWACSSASAGPIPCPAGWPRLPGEESPASAAGHGWPWNWPASPSASARRR